MFTFSFPWIIHSPHHTCHFILHYLLLHNLMPFSICFIFLLLIFICLHGFKLVSLFLAFPQQQPLWQISISFQFLSLQEHSLVVILSALTSPEPPLRSGEREEGERQWRARWRVWKGLAFNQPQAVIWGLGTQPVNQHRPFHNFFLDYQNDLHLSLWLQEHPWYSIS